MTLRRYAPLALAALALACKPDIEQRANATTVDYALFNPAVGQIPTPNDAAFSKVAQYYATGGTKLNLPCTATLVDSDPAVSGLGTTGVGLCVYARAGGFPAPTPVTIGFVRGTLASDGAVSYRPAPGADALNAATLVYADGLATAPTIGVFDLSAPTPADFPKTPSASPFNAVSGNLTLVAPGGAWTAGHKYAVMVLGGALGPRTLTGGEYTAMPPFYVLREAVIANLDLSKPENQGLFPGDAAAKAASGTALEPLRAGYHFLYETGGFNAGTASVNLPFSEAISLQTFQIAPTATITLGDGTGQADTTVTAGAVGQVDAFSLRSDVQTSTIAAVLFALTSGDTAISNLFVSRNADCSGTPLGVTASAPTTAVPNVIPLTASLPSVGTTTVDLYVCATTSAAGTVTGTVTAVSPFTGLTFTAAGSDATGATLTVN